jgi:hypothetical protein
VVVLLGGCGGGSSNNTTTQAAATPVISPVGGTFTAAQSVTITDSTASATIYYTTDGTTPTTSSTQYTGAISVATSETIEAIAVASGYNTSSTASESFTISTATSVESVSINMSNASGAPTYRASGFIYGISQDVTTPVASLQSQINTRLMRAGGSQIGCPDGGWINGEIAPRWNFVQLYYARAVSVGATYVMILPGLWGADGVCTVPSYPGDNGDWTQYLSFLNEVIADVKAAGMTGSNVQWDIWNEPDGSFWGGRSQSQYLDMWKLGYQTIRAALPNAVITGPSTAGQPNSSSTWWATYLTYIKANNVIPDYLGWHDEAGGNDPVMDANNLNTMLTADGITAPAFEVNEYGAYGEEQQPGPSAWYIARYERSGIALAARGNWGMVGETPSLYDTMGWLVTSDTDETMGQWWVYQRYAEQTGLQTEITPSAHIDGTVFQDSSAKHSSAVIGNKSGGPTGNIDVTYTNIPTWLVSSGKTNVQLERMPSTNAYVDAPIEVSNSAVTVSGNSITVTIDWTNALDAYAITLTPGS